MLPEDISKILILNLKDGQIQSNLVYFQFKIILIYFVTIISVMKDALGWGNVKSRETDASHYIRGHKRRITLAHIIRGLQPSWIPQYGDFFCNFWIVTNFNILIVLTNDNESSKKLSTLIRGHPYIT